MSDKEARVVAAGDYCTIGGVEYRAKPLSLRELAEVQRQALKAYKRSYLETYQDNKEILGEGWIDVLTAKVEEVARWDIGDLPKKRAFDVTNVKLTKKLKDKLEELYKVLPEGEAAVRSLLNTALDAGDLSINEVVSLSGTRPATGLISYDMWWVTAMFEGMTTLVWVGLRSNHPDLEKSVIETADFAELVVAARLIEKLTAPQMGNT